MAFKVIYFYYTYLGINSKNRDQKSCLSARSKEMCSLMVIQYSVIVYPQEIFPFFYIFVLHLTPEYF